MYAFTTFTNTTSEPSHRSHTITPVSNHHTKIIPKSFELRNNVNKSRQKQQHVTQQVSFFFSSTFRKLKKYECIYVSKIVWFWYDDSMMVWKWYDCMTSVWWFANSSKVRIGTNSNQIAAEDHPCTIFRFSTRLDVQN